MTGQDITGQDSQGARKPAHPSRGTRLSPDWQPTTDDVDYAVSKGFSGNAVSQMAEKFRNYWTAKAGAAASKIDWAATWRNWVLNEAERRPTPTGSRNWSGLDQAIAGLELGQEFEGDYL